MSRTIGPGSCPAVTRLATDEGLRGLLRASLRMGLMIAERERVTRLAKDGKDEYFRFAVLDPQQLDSVFRARLTLVGE